ncbi:alpha/beta hydrolase, partial [Pandoraea nosoerga]|nr:alpha/beta hydrolase [Pandoraea nosoerga]
MTGPPPSLPERIRTDEADVLMLPDGRALAYLEWGDSTGYPAFYFHGTPSSRLEGAFADGAARRTGFRLIAIDRPGYG